MEELGYLVIGAVAGAVLGPRTRPLLLGAATAGYKIADAVSARTSEQRKGVEAFFAEQRKGVEAFFAEQRKGVEAFFAEQRKGVEAFFAEAREKARKPQPTAAPAEA
jgi:hypothetical protein